MLDTINGRLSALGLLPSPSLYLDKADTQHMVIYRTPMLESALKIGDKEVLSVKMYSSGSLVEVPLQLGSTSVWEI